MNDYDSETRDSDQHRMVSKNGKEHIQDGDIRRLFEQSKDHHEQFVAFTAKDLASHVILEKSVEAISNKFGKYVFGGRIIWAGVLASLIAFSSLGGWFLSELGSHDDQIKALQGAQQTTMQRADDNRDKVIDNQQDIRELRKLVTQHQINKREHHSRGQE